MKLQIPGPTANDKSYTNFYFEDFIPFIRSPDPHSSDDSPRPCQHTTKASRALNSCVSSVFKDSIAEFKNMFKIKEQKRFSIYSTMLFPLTPDITKLMTPNTLFSVVETYLTTP